MKRRLGIAIVCVATFGASGPARAQEGGVTKSQSPPDYTFDGNVMRIRQGASSTSVEIGCAGRQALRVEDKIYVACGKGGVVQVDASNPISPRRAGSMAVDGEATGIFLHDGVVWVQVQHVDARPVKISPEIITIAPPPASVTAPPPPLAAPQTTPEPTPVPPAPEAEATPQRSAAEPEPPSLTAPPRQSDLWDISLFTSAFVAFGSLGGGLLGSASVAYRFTAPLVIRAEVVPFGIGAPSHTTTTQGGSFGQPIAGTSPSSGSATTFGAHAVIGLDTQLIEVGLGVGGVTLNEGSTTGSQPQSGALSIAEVARIGARDGLALNVETSAIALSNRFDLGYFVSSFQIPVSRTVMLVVRGGGGNVGFGYGDVGVRVMTHGDGGKGTIALSGYAGGDLINMNLCAMNPDPPNATTCTTANLAGPSLGGGIEWKH